MPTAGHRDSFRIVDGHLHFGDALLSLTPKEMAVLALLVDAGTTPVTTDRLITAVWGDDPVGPESLHRCISTIRKKLAEHHDGPTIATHHRIGYSLAIPIHRDIRPDSAADAAELLRQAMELAAGRTRTGLLRALERIDQAIALDPSYAPAHQLKGHALIAWAMHRYSVPRDTGSELLQVSERLLMRFPRSGDVLAFRGFAKAVIFGESDGIESLDQAVDREPENWFSRLYRAWALAGLGDFGRARADLDVAWSRNPGGTGLVGSYAFLTFCSGDPEKALAVIRSAGDTIRFMASAQSAHAIAASWLGFHEEAEAAGRRAAELLEGSPTMAVSLVYALARAGKTSEARELLAGIEGRDIGAAPSILAPAYLALGEGARVPAALRQAQAEGCVYRHLLKYDPRMEPASG